MGASVGCGQADESTASVGIEVRSALAHEIRSPQKSVTSGGNFRCLIREPFIGIAAIVRAGAELVAKPAQGKAGGLGHTHHVPASGDGVAESMQAACGFECGTVGRGEHHTGCSNGGTHRPRSDDPHADGARRLVSGTRNNGSSLFQPSG